LANQLENSDLIIQLPWTVPQPPNVQTIVLQQPAKTHMELNASTDKTAISSFALSVVFALILGGLATWLAYWYGRKSFDLTKQSFDAVIKQIESSEKAAQDLNTRIFEQQKELQDKDFIFKDNESWKNRLLDKAESFLSSRFDFILMYQEFLSDNQSVLFQSKKPENLKKIIYLDKLLRVVLSKNHILILNLKSGKSRSRIESLGTIFMHLGWACRKQMLHFINHNELVNDKEEINKISSFIEERELFEMKELNRKLKALHTNYYDLLIETSSLIDDEIKSILHK